jgi:hypothetical protein
VASCETRGKRGIAAAFSPSLFDVPLQITIPPLLHNFLRVSPTPEACDKLGYAAHENGSSTSPETSIDSYPTIRRNIPEDCSSILLRFGSG